MEIFKASHQWATRPQDERFTSLEALDAACLAYRKTAFEREVPYADIRVEADGNDIRIAGRANNPANITHYAFGQLAARVGAPAEYLRNLPATLAAQNLNHGLKARAEDGDVAQVLLHANGSLLARAFTSDKYARIWNADITPRLLALQNGDGWEPARPTFRWDGSTVAADEPPALYASDKDLFAFLLRKDRAIQEPGTDKPIYRGVIVENSEVGDAALKLTRFWFRAMCGNHIIWGAENVSDISIRHVGDAQGRWASYSAELRRYADGAASLDEAAITAAKTKLIAGTKDEVLDKLFGIRSLRLSRRTLTAAYAAALPDVDGDPRTAWGFAQGLTRFSQTAEAAYADRRTEIDRAAGRLLAIQF